MARPKNADATTFRSGEQAVENGRKGGKASAAKRAERKSIREGLLLLLNEPLKDRDGKDSGKTTQDAMIAGVMKRAIAGDVRAAEFIRDTIGEKPEEMMKLKAQFRQGDFEIVVEPEEGDADDRQD